MHFPNVGKVLLVHLTLTPINERKDINNSHRKRSNGHNADVSATTITTISEVKHERQETCCTLL